MGPGPPYDTVIRGGRIIDPASGVDGIGDVAIRFGKIAAVSVGTPLDSAGAELHDAAGKIVCPGLVDTHVHVFDGITPLGLDADTHCECCKLQPPHAGRGRCRGLCW